MLLEKTGTQSYPAIEYLPCGSGTAYKIGMCLKIASGVAAKCAATDAPQYICFGEKTGVTGEAIPAVRVSKDDTYAAALTVSGAALSVGDKVTLHTDGIKVTATTSSGVAEIVGFATAAQAAGDTVYVKF